MVGRYRKVNGSTNIPLAGSGLGRRWELRDPGTRENKVKGKGTEGAECRVGGCGEAGVWIGERGSQCWSPEPRPYPQVSGLA